MMPHKSFLTVLFLFVFIAAPLLAHHSVSAGFDETKATTIQGVITKMEVINPHVWITLDSKDANGAITSWRVEIASPNALMREGIRRENFELAKPCSLEIWPARDGSKTANGRKLTYADGKTFDIHDRFAEFVPGIPLK